MKLKPNQYLLEPILNSELILINNTKLLKNNKNLYDHSYIDRIEELRLIYISLEDKAESGEKGLQKEKRQIRDELRDLSYKTFIYRDSTLFGQMITTMTNKIATRPQFSGYTFIDEMKSLGIEHILKYSIGFNPYRQSLISGQYASAFAYISTIIFNAFVATINKFQKDQKKSKEEFLETQKLIHKTPNVSTYDDDYSTPSRAIKFVKLEDGELLTRIKEVTILEETKFLIPLDYKITAKEHDFILKYEYNISIVRIKS